jgi:Luciferase-like monooxygenase
VKICEHLRNQRTLLIRPASDPEIWFSNRVDELLRPLFGQSGAGLRRYLSDSWGLLRLTLVESWRVGFDEVTPVEVRNAQSTSRPQSCRVSAKDTLLQFAIFGSAQADSERPGAALAEGFHEFVEFNVEAEALGYCASFPVAHHLTGWNQVPSTLQLLSWLAARTTTLRLGSAVLVLPWHNPLLLAEQAATLDLTKAAQPCTRAGRFGLFESFRDAPTTAESRPNRSRPHPSGAWPSRVPHLTRDDNTAFVRVPVDGGISYFAMSVLLRFADHECHQLGVWDSSGGSSAPQMSASPARHSWSATRFSQSPAAARARHGRLSP